MAVVALVACVSGIRNGFAQDDVALLRDSNLLHHLSGWTLIVSSPYWPPPYAADQYRPITSLLLALQYTVASGAPLVFRLLSYALYAGAAVVFLGLAKRILPLFSAVSVALLFAAHPVHVEAVALAVGQGELIVAIMAMLMTIRYLDARRSDPDHMHASAWVMLAAMYAAAALSKEQGFLLPVFAVLAEISFVQDGAFAQRLRKLWKGYAGLALVGIGVLLVRTAVLGRLTAQPNVAEALLTKTLAGRAVTMLQIVPQWLRLLFWPAHLRADYSPQEFVGSSALGAPETLGLVLLLTLVAVAWAMRRRAPAVTFGLAWCAVALFPVSNVFIATGVLIAERTLLLPSAGFLIAVGGVITLAMKQVPARNHVRDRVLIATACGVLTLLGIARSGARQRVWRDNDALSLASVKDAPRSWRVAQSYGEAMFRLGRPQAGVSAFRLAITLAPSPWWVRNALAKHLRAMGDDAAAADQLYASLAEFPGQIEAVPELTAALLGLGRYREARDIASNVIASGSAPPVMIRLRQVADSAIVVNAAPGTIQVGSMSP